MDVTSGSTPYVHVPVTADDTLTGAPFTPTDPPRFAFLPDGAARPTDSDWVAGEWTSGYARLQLGVSPAPTLDPGWYRLWLRFTAGAETILEPAGWIHVT